MTTKPEWPKGESNLERSYNIIAEWVNATTPMQIEHEQFSVLQKLIYAALEAKESAVQASTLAAAADIAENWPLKSWEDQYKTDIAAAIRALASTPAGEGITGPRITKPYTEHLAERLQDKQHAIGYLSAASLEDDDVFKLAIKDVAEAWGVLPDAHAALRLALQILELLLSGKHIYDENFYSKLTAARDTVAKALGERDTP